MSDDNQIQNIFNEVEVKQGYRSTDINGKQYSIKLMPARTGVQVGMKLVELIGPGVASFADSWKRQDMVLPEDDNKFSDLAMFLVNQMGKVNVLDLIDVMLKDSEVEGEKLNWDSEFVGDYGSLIALVEFALKENFGNFMKQWLASKGIQLPSLKDLMSQPEDKQQESSEESSN